MAIPLSYAFGSYQPRVRRVLGTLASLVSAAAAYGIVTNSLQLADLLKPDSCGTGRQQTAQALFFVMPVVLTMPACAWGVARFANFGVLISRASFYAALAGWLTCIGVVMFG